MRGFRLLLFIGLLIYPKAGVPVWGQTDVFPSKMIVGIARWQDQGVPPEYSYLLRNLPAQLLAAAAECEVHRLSVSEQEALQQKQVERQKVLLENEVSQLRRTLDEMLFDQRKSEEDRVKAREAWEKKRESWLSFEADSIVTSKELSEIVLALHEKTSNQELLPVFSGPPETYPEAVDYLIHGSVEQVEGILYFTMGIFSFWEDRELVSLERAYLSEEGGRFLEEARLVMIDTLLGRDWASLTVRTRDAEASLYLNGSLVGSGGVNLPYLAPGSYQVQAKAPGYRIETIEVELVPRQSQTVELVLTPLDWTSIQISTIPDGADLYLGSQWLGLSPWEGELPPGQTILSVRKQGYLETSRYLPEKRKDNIGILLPVESFKIEHLMETQKKRFYSSLGAFVLTLPVPFILQGISRYSAQAWYSETSLYGSSAETERLRRVSLLSYYGSQGALFIQGALFVNMVIDAVRYVKTTDLMFTR